MTVDEVGDLYRDHNVWDSVLLGSPVSEAIKKYSHIQNIFKKYIYKIYLKNIFKKIYLKNIFKKIYFVCCSKIMKTLLYKYKYFDVFIILLDFKNHKYFFFFRFT